MSFDCISFWVICFWSVSVKRNALGVQCVPFPIFKHFNWFKIDERTFVRLHTRSSYVFFSMVRNITLLCSHIFGTSHNATIAMYWLEFISFDAVFKLFLMNPPITLALLYFSFAFHNRTTAQFTLLLFIIKEDSDNVNYIILKHRLENARALIG